MEKNPVKEMTREEKFDHVDTCIKLLRSIKKEVEEAKEKGDKDLVIAYLELQCQKTMELANTYSILLEEKGNETLKELTEQFKNEVWISDSCFDDDGTLN